MEKRRGEMEPVSAALGEAERVLSGNDAFQFWLFQQKWEKIIGDVLASESYIGRQYGDVLYIYVTNSVWMQELMMQKAEILRRVQEDPYGARFRDIRFQMGPRKPHVAPSLPALRLEPLYDTRRRDAPVTEAEEAWIDCWTKEHVPKDELRAPIADMMRGALRRRKEELAQGFHPCARCGVLVPKARRLCDACQVQDERERRNLAVLVLKEHPELLYEEVRRAVPCTYRQFAEARDILIHRYRENFLRRCGTEEERRRLLSLLTHKPFASITEEEARRVLSALPARRIDWEDAERRQKK